MGGMYTCLLIWNHMRKKMNGDSLLSVQTLHSPYLGELELWSLPANNKTWILLTRPPGHNLNNWPFQNAFFSLLTLALPWTLADIWEIFEGSQTRMTCNTQVSIISELFNFRLHILARLDWKWAALHYLIKLVCKPYSYLYNYGQASLLLVSYVYWLSITIFTMFAM